MAKKDTQVWHVKPSSSKEMMSMEANKILSRMSRYLVMKKPDLYNKELKKLKRKYPDFWSQLNNIKIRTDND